MPNQTPVRDYEKMLIRVPPGMREALSGLAKANARSVNAEVIALLTWAITEAQNPSEAVLQKLSRQLEEMREVVSVIREVSPEIDAALVHREKHSADGEDD